MESSAPQTDPTVPPTLDYGHAGSGASPWYRRLWADLQQRVDGALEFIGLIIYFLGGARRIGLAVGLAAFAGGLGLCLDPDALSDGPRWMCIGGFLVGLLLLAPQRKKG